MGEAHFQINLLAGGKLRICFHNLQSVGIDGRVNSGYNEDNPAIFYLPISP